MLLDWSRRRAACLGLVTALALTAIAVTARLGRAPLGLAFSASPERGGDAVEGIRLLDSAALEDLGAGAHRVAWRGYWLASSRGRQRLRVRSPAPFELRVGGRTVLAGASGVARGEVWVERGANAFALELAGVSGRTRLRVTHAEERSPWQGFSASELASQSPRRGELLLRRLGRDAEVLAVAAWSLALGFVLWPERRRVAFWLARLPRLVASPRLAWALGVLVVAYAAALRTEALIARYGEVDAGGWAERLEARLGELHSNRLRWKRAEDPYKGDPSAYLRHARGMKGFYDARFREPFFVYAAKVGVELSGGSDIGISLASATFSTLAVAATFLLGARAFSPWVGLLAAAAFAVDERVIGLSPEGWRDDAFAFLCVACAWATLRLYDAGRFRDALLLGLLGGFACLTRITSLSFVVPTLMALTLVPRSRPARVRLERVAVAGVLCAALVAPFLLSCWVAFGDPLVSINWVAPAYQAGSGLDMGRPMGVAEYFATRFRTFELLDTLLVGATAYPFARKWNFDYLSPNLAAPAAAASAAGMLLLCLVPRTRLLVMLFAAALLPFTLTWNVRGGDAWRLTLFAYPFYLVAGAFVACSVARIVASRSARSRLAPILAERSTWMRLAVIMGGTGLVAVASLVLPYLRAAESLRNGQRALVLTGLRDRLFFGAGWHAPACTKNNCARYTDGARSWLRVPLQEGRDYVLRFKAFPLSLPGMRPQRITLLANGTPLGDVELDAAGPILYEARWPARATIEGTNLLEMRAAYSTRVASSGRQEPQARPGWRTAFALLHFLIAPGASS